LVTGFAVGFAAELEVGFVAGFDVDVEVVVDVVCPITCNTAIKQITTVAVAIRFIAGLPRDYCTVICRPMGALGAIAPADGPKKLQIGPRATQSTTGDYSASGGPGNGTEVLASRLSSGAIPQCYCYPLRFLDSDGPRQAAYRARRLALPGVFMPGG
jgi:hypothetical protein